MRKCVMREYADSKHPDLRVHLLRLITVFAAHFRIASRKHAYIILTPLNLIFI